MNQEINIRSIIINNKTLFLAEDVALLLWKPNWKNKVGVGKPRPRMRELRKALLDDSIRKSDYLTKEQTILAIVNSGKKLKNTSLIDYVINCESDLKFDNNFELKREEYVFGENIINNLFSRYTVIPQYPVLNNEYRIDWYISELNLAIEFDENHHTENLKEDRIRQEKIEKELKCKFIRYTC